MSGSTIFSKPKENIIQTVSNINQKVLLKMMESSSEIWTFLNENREIKVLLYYEFLISVNVNLTPSPLQIVEIPSLFKNAIRTETAGQKDFNGFANERWKKSALKIVYHISKFIAYLKQSNESCKFKVLNSKMFAMI